MRSSSTILVITAVLMAGFVSVLEAAPRSGSTQKSSNFLSKLFEKSQSSNSTRRPTSARRPRISSSSSSRTRSSSSRRSTNYASSGVKVRHMVLSSASRSSTRLVVDISKQKAYLLANGKVAITTPVSTARRGKRTPRGTFRMSQRVRSGKISTIYGSAMPYWMRLSGTAYGVHAGYLPGYPASAGCVRLPAAAAQLIYDHTQSGTRVNIYSSWSGS